MTDSHIQTKQRLENIFQKVMDENKEKIKYIDNSNKEIEKDLSKLKDPYLELLRKSCSFQFRWLEEHATVFSNENGIHIHVNQNPDSMYADAILGELDSCASKNDQGLRAHFNQSNIKKSTILKTNEQCMAKCAFRADDKSDHEIKSCIDDCLHTSFEQSKAVLDETKDKLKQVKNLFQI